MHIIPQLLLLDLYIILFSLILLKLSALVGGSQVSFCSPLVNCDDNDTGFKMFSRFGVIFLNPFPRSPVSLKVVLVDAFLCYSRWKKR